MKDLSKLLPALKDPMYPPEQWGSTMSELTGERIHGAIYRAPDGLVMVAACTQCGERREVLLDPKLDRAGLESGMRFVAELHDDSHVCPEGGLPMQEDLEHLAERMKSTTEQLLAEGDEPPVSFILLNGDDELDVIALPAFDRDTKAKTFAVGQYAVRELRRRAENIKGVAGISLAWSVTGPDPDLSVPPSQHQDRQEVVIITLVTKTAGAMLMGTIARDGDPRDAEGRRMDTGPGHVVEWKLTALGPSRFADGCFA